VSTGPSVWRGYAGQGPDEQWDKLVTWVAWLLESYEPWVRLPTCWPRHMGLRSELVFFHAWHEQIMEDGDAFEGVNWHAALRSAAAAWEQVTGCRHEEQSWKKGGRMNVEDFERHLEAARSVSKSRILPRESTS